MQTMKYTCFAFLQRWPTSRTQKHSFNTDVLTVINLTVLHARQDHAVCHTNVLESLALCWFTAEDGSHEHFACLLSAWFYHGRSPPNCRSKYQADSDMDTDTNSEKKKKIIPTGNCRYFNPFQKLMTHLQGQKCSQLSRHKPIKSISCTSELGSTIILFTRVDSQNKTLEKDTR